MDAIETAIRNAFEKGDAEDRTFREAVYRKAFAALDRALKANQGITVESAIRRRKVLQQKIMEIEQEYIPAVAPQAGPVDPYPSEDPLSGAVEMRLEPGEAPEIIALDPSHDIAVPRVEGELDRSALSGIDTRGEARAPAAAGRTASRASSVDPDPDPRRPRRRRRPVIWLFIAVTVLAAVGLGGWFAAGTGLFLSPAERDTSVPNPPKPGEESYIPEDEEPPVLSSQPDAQRDWIAIFSPGDAEAISAPTGTRAEAMQDDTGAFLRIGSGSAGEAISFDVGQGVLEKIAGKKVTFDIVARAAQDGGTEMAVDCNFGELGDCGRKRYALTYDPGDYLFELTLPAEQPGAAGAIAINPDFSGSGKAVDIYEIKVSPSP